MSTDLAGRIIQAQLVQAAGLLFLADDAGQVPVSRQHTCPAEGGWWRVRAMHATDHKWMIGVAAQENHDDFVTCPGQRQGAEFAASPATGDTDPRRVALRA